MHKKIHTQSNEIAFFDFDGTITSKDTLAEIIKFIKGSFSYYIGVLILSPVIFLYKLKLMPNYRAKEILLTYFLKGMDAKKFDEACKEFTDKKLPDLFKKSALQEIRKHIQNNTPVIVISASAENWVLPWCNKFNIKCIATKLEVKNGKLTGKIDGKNCSGEEKVKLIINNYELSTYTKIHAYGDSRSDLPMLELATEKYYRPFRELIY